MHRRPGRRGMALGLACCCAACGPGGTDGDDTDTDAPPAQLVTFTTSVVYDRDLKAAGEAASGLEGADALCLRHARAAGFEGTWRAWLSDTTADAVDRVAGEGPWARPDGAVAFPNRASLEAVPMVALGRDEYGRPAQATCAWTNTHVGGRRAADCRWEGDEIDDGCAHATFPPGEPYVIAAVGSPGATDAGWTDVDAASAFIPWWSCALYCLQGP